MAGTEDFWNDVLNEKDTPTVLASEPIDPKIAVPAVTAPVATEVAETPKPTTDLSDEDLLKILNQRGVNISSFEDLKPKPTEAEILAAKEKRTNEVLAYGLQNGKVKKEDYDALKTAEANKLSLVVGEIENAIRTANPEMDEAEIQDKISTYTLSHLDDNDVLKIARQKELLELADARLKNKYSSIYNLENDYSQYEQAEQSKYQLKRKVEAALPVYKNDVEQVLSSLKKMDFVIEDKENPDNTATIPFEVNDEDLNELRQAYLNGEQALPHLKNGYTVESLTQAGRLFLIDKKLSAMVSHSAKLYNSIQKDKYIKGRKGLIPSTDLDISASTSGNTLTDQFWKDVIPAATQPTQQ